MSAGGQGWVHTGSINGSENSVKQNREMAVQVKSTQAFDDLARVFEYDWIASGGVQPVPVLVDDFYPQPLPDNTVWHYNRLSGDRGQVDGWWNPICSCSQPNGGGITWGKGIVTATITQTQGTEAWVGLWTSFNHPVTEEIPLDFSAIFPPQVITQFQGRVTRIRLHVLRGNGTLQLELQAPDLSIAWTHAMTLSGGEQAVQLPPSLIQPSRPAIKCASMPGNVSCTSPSVMTQVPPSYTFSSRMSTRLGGASVQSVVRT